MSFLSPKEILNQISKSGSAKVETNTQKVLILSFLAGAYIAFAGFLAIKIGGGIPGIKATNPGLAKLIFAGVFPVGLMFVIMAGAELFTGNTALLIPALRKREVKITKVAKNWSLSFFRLRFQFMLRNCFLGCRYGKKRPFQKFYRLLEGDHKIPE